MKTATKLAKPIVILAEGIQDQNLIEAVSRHMDKHQLIDVRNQGRNTRINAASVAAIKNLGRGTVQVLAIIVDSDENCARTFQHYCSIMKAAGFQIPNAPGMLSEPDHDGIRVGVLVLPVNQPGEHDQLLWSYIKALVPPLGDEIEGFLSRVPDVNPSNHEEVNSARHKSDKMAVRIATTVGVAVPQGRALKGLRLPQWVFDEDFWDWEHPVFADVLTFISLIAETV